jgi:hypothetical protein
MSIHAHGRSIRSEEHFATASNLDHTLLDVPDALAVYAPDRECGPFAANRIL